MKIKISRLQILLVCSILLLLNNRCDTNGCDQVFEIDELQPDTNPAGYEIRIVGQPFSESATVRFGNKVATTRWDETQNTILAKVPTGLSGLLEVTVEEGECLARADFEVTGNYTTNWPPALPVIVIPQNPSTFPSNFTNLWHNIADEDHRIFLGSDNATTALTDDSAEFHLSNSKLNENPVRGTVNIAQNKIFMTINRTAHGGMNDTLDGKFILPASAGITDKDFAILLESRASGRQMVLVQF